MSASLPQHVAVLARELAALPDVVGVALGGSRATDAHSPDSDWDLGLYYRTHLDPDRVRALGYQGHVSERGEWGPIMDGGAWLTVAGDRVDVLFRDLDRVERWCTDAERGEFEVLAQNGYLAGAPTYTPVGELALGRPIHGQLPRPAFPDALASAAPGRWEGRAAVSLMFARQHAQAEDAVGCVGMLAHAVLCAGHARLAQRHEWVVGEKRLVQRAGLEEAQSLLVRPVDLTTAVDRVGALLRVEPLAPR